MRKKKLFFSLAIVVLLCSIALEIYRVLNHESRLSFVSPSGLYREELVVVKTFISPFKGVSYMRFFEVKHPDSVYRTPVLDLMNLDMKDYEDDKEVGVFFLSFLKEKKVFEISLPNWCSHWMNVFVSNTPYTVYGNGDCNY